MKRKSWRVEVVLVLIGIVASVFSVSGTAPLRGESSRRVSVLLHPKRDEVVSRNYEVMGKSAGGCPLVLIRPDVAGGEWWIQPPAQLNERGSFKTKVRFGNDRTKPGDKFQVVVLTLRTAEEAQLFKDKEFLVELPDLQRSEIIPVSVAEDLEKAAPPEKPIDIIAQPKANSKVQTITNIVGKMPENRWPVVLVRSDEPNDTWWVQGPVTMGKDNTFMVKGRFGNDKTASGRGFQIVVLALPAERDAAEFQPGNTMPELPPDEMRSTEVTVKLQHATEGASRSEMP